MGGLIFTIAFFAALLGAEIIFAIPGAIEKRRKARAEDRFLRWRLQDEAYMEAMKLKEEY